MENYLSMQERECLTYRILNHIDEDTLERDVVATKDYSLLALLFDCSGEHIYHFSPHSVKTIIASGNKRLIRLMLRAEDIDCGSSDTDEVIDCLAAGKVVPFKLLVKIDDLDLLEFLAENRLAAPKQLVKALCASGDFTKEEINLLATKEERIPGALFDKIVREDHWRLMCCLLWMQRLSEVQMLKVIQGKYPLATEALIKHNQLSPDLQEEIIATGNSTWIELLSKTQEVSAVLN